MGQYSVSVLVGLIVSAPVAADTLADLWDAARRAGKHRKPDAEELRMVEDLFKRTLQGKEELASLQKSWRRLHYELTALEENGQSFLVLQELAEHKTGRGFYLFRRGPALAVAVQAPHGWNDLHTGAIALKLFQEHPLRAGAWNTVTRSDADLAHLPENYFQAFTRAFAEIHRLGILVQLHGFEMSKRKSEAGEEADVVVSNGSKQPPGWLLALAREWKDSLTRKVKVYPLDIWELGGTTNAQAQLLHNLGNDGFLHVEMSLGFRQRLRDDAELREGFFKAVRTVYRKERDDHKK